MSNAGFSGFPPGFRPGGASGEASSIHAQQPVKLVDLPEGLRQNLQNLRETLKLRGEVVRENADNTVRIRTPRGDIDVRIPEGRGERPEPGTRVEIEIQPARQAQGQSTPDIDLAALRVTRPAPQIEQTQPPPTQQAPQTPRPQQYTPVLQTASAAPSGLPPEGVIVRLSPLPTFSPSPQSPPEILNQTLNIPAQPPVINNINVPAPIMFTPIPDTQPGLPLLPSTDAQIVTPAAGTRAQTPTTNSLPAAGAIVTQPLEAGSLTSNTPSSAPVITTESNVKIEKVLSPEVSIKTNTPQPNPILGNQRAESINGIVSGITEDGARPVITLFFPQSGQTQQFVLESRADQVTIGTRLQLTPQSAGTQAQSVQAAALPPLPFLAQPGAWPAMEELQHTLTRAAPQVAQAMNALTPSPSQPTQMGPAMMFFIAAVRGGDLQSWMGEKALEALQKGNKNLLSRLTQEGQALGRIASDSTGQDWRIAHIPLAWEGQIQKAAIYYKHEKSENDETADGPKGTRFVFDLALDAMGKVQIDGLYRPISADGKRLDLALRTEQSFSEATRSEMRRVYASALKGTDVSGSLDFQSRGEGWVTVYVEDDMDEVEVRV